VLALTVQIILHYSASISIIVYQRGGCMATKKDLVRELRLNKRLTQAEVAAKMRISQGSYSAIERGQKPRAVEEALTTINRMRTRTDRTDGGAEKTGRLKD
jgi:DNA-binding XRE family transcriptional regulator